MGQSVIERVLLTGTCLRGEYYGQRPRDVPHQQAGHMAAPTSLDYRKFPCQTGAVHIWPITSGARRSVLDHSVTGEPPRQSAGVAARSR